MKTGTAMASDGSTVDTAWWEITNDEGPVTIEISAQFGTTQVNGRIAVGAEDAVPDGATQESMQAAVDALRQKVVDIAAAREESRKRLVNLK
jgi:hypothetical protein